MITYAPIGRIRTPFRSVEGMPVQAAAAGDVEGQVFVDEAYATGLRDLDGFSHIILLYHFDRAAPARLQAVPYLDTEARGVFATRAPARPNPIGLSVVRLVGIDGTVLRVAGVDMLDGTPLLDIKPYVPAFDAVAAERVGWLAGAGSRLAQVRADGRFAAPGAGSGDCGKGEEP